MPRRPRHLSYTPPSRTLLSLSTSPIGPSRTPLTPPLRLRERTLLPSPPLSPQFLACAPSTPRPWIWRCHLCGKTYELGVTRRCLEDGHYFCSLPSPPASPVGRKRKKARGCRSEFDYSGWTEYNMWRSEVRRMIAERRSYSSPSLRSEPPYTSRTTAILSLEDDWDEDESLDEMLDKNWAERNCWTDCTFPSACNNIRASFMRERQARRDAPRSLEGRYVSASPSPSTSSSSSEEYEGEETKKFATNEPGEGTSEEEEQKSPDLTDEELKSLYLDMVIKPSDEPDVQIKDCDGLGEQEVRLEFTKSKRRKSIDAFLHGEDQGEPNSPLKQESGWGLGDRGKEDDAKTWKSDAGSEEERIWWKEVDFGVVDHTNSRTSDEQEREELATRGRSLMRRSVNSDDACERFGDEEDEDEENMQFIV